MKSPIFSSRPNTTIKPYSFLFSLYQLLPVQVYQVHGQSMAPNIPEGTKVVVNRLAYLFSPPKTGDVVAVNHPDNGKVLIKRVVQINGEIMSVEGDNKAGSTDSRHFGPVKKKELVGKVIFTT